MLSPKDGSTQALQRHPRVLRYAMALQVHTPEKHGRFGLDHVRFDVAPSSLEAFEVRVMQPDAAITYSSLNPDTCTLFG